MSTSATAAHSQRPVGAPCWIDLMTSDASGAQAFYTELFGWSAVQSSQEEYGGYISFSLGGRDVAGCMAKEEGSPYPDAWSVYLRTDDVAATVARVREHGGQVYVEPMEIPAMGHMAFVGDTGGEGIGMWQPAPFGGFEALDEPGAPCWFELHSRSYDADVAFYADVFGWQTEVMSDSPEFRYTTLGKDDEARAGIMDATGFLGDEPSRWQFYVEVADTDATVEQARATGAQLLLPVDDTPYGRIGALLDPAGVRFQVMGPNAKAT
jgi:predicted enzyme related to lactoylglutathione lyase